MWDDKYKEIFQKLRTFLTSIPILTLPIEGKDFIMYSNASWFGLGVVLMQGKKVIVYELRQLNPY